MLSREQRNPLSEWWWAWARTSELTATIAVSLLTRPRDERELTGLVYSLTERPRDARLAWYRRPAVLGAAVLAATLMLNLVFF